MPKDRKSTRLNSSYGYISYAVFCLKKKTNITTSHHSHFFFNDTPTTELYTLSLHDALPISHRLPIREQPWNEPVAKQQTVHQPALKRRPDRIVMRHDACFQEPRHLIAVLDAERSEEHTSELQLRLHLVCRLLLEKKNKHYNITPLTFFF